MNSQQKQCPSCQAVQPIGMATCFKCGHIFQTPIGSQASNQTQAVPVYDARAGFRNKFNSVIVYGGLGLFVIAGIYLFFYFVMGSPLAGTWLSSSDSGISQSATKMILRRDGTGEIQAGRNLTEENKAGSFRPFRWHTEGSLFFMEPVDPSDESAPIAQPYKLYDQNRYLSINLFGTTTRWRRDE